MIELPPSKSIGARYMVATYFAGTLPADPFFQDNEDLMVLQEALLEVYSDEEPIDYGDSPIDVGASGTALRFVTAVCASSQGADYVVTGTPRLMQRPMAPLLDLLKEAGAGVEALGENGTGPYRVKGGTLKGGSFSIRGDISSQFISALMLVAPSWENGMKLSFTTPLVSKPYIEMTAKLMEKFGIKTELTNETVEVPKARYIEPFNFKVEADWSSASFFYEACAINGEKLEIHDLVSPRVSLQGDSMTESLFTLLGVESHFNKEGATIQKQGDVRNDIVFNFKDYPDLVLPFAVACLCTNVHFRFEGVSNLRLKESDRLESLRSEALKLGFDVKIGDDFVEWNGLTIEREENPIIDPHDDHRVAMSFTMAALKFGEIRIEHPEVVEKSFIDFWNQIPKIGLQCEEIEGVMIIKNNLIH
ncbi:MAG: 3-phosphoshikimate 1-carboxyvinyltransferase [Muribaculaceae bacterium]|nr:3-phosphoshikimate 1-carboxyvinyltransferase [Muribaculaceae bacterium]